MKTKVVMIRQMGGLDVHQRTDNGMFNATSLLKQWNNKTGMRKEVSKFMALEQTKDFLDVLVEEENLDTHKSAYVNSKASRGENVGTWMHPFLFIKFAMWINPRFEYNVIKFVYDELIKNRHDAGDMYRTLSSSGMRLKGYKFDEVAKALQWIVFNKTGKNLRQTATQEQLRELAELQNKLAFAIDMGYIRSYEQLISEMRKIWNDKNNPVKQLKRA